MTDSRRQMADIIRKMKEKADKLVTIVVLETDAKLKEQSPVDTGQFRSSWRISEGEIDPSTGEEQVYSETIEAGKDYYLTNSLPYAQRLAEGWSKQAPTGWVELIAAGIPGRAEQIARALNNEP